ncbi:hypothetical protein [Gimesia panareensis]|uniref:Uncharacterized protein n=1 Tax=Gimesia panareensis TaxID=2527978 RepID=A0A517QAC0_9PLAN|nr:hypothetical protein [Gimesia panareensis]QDT28572.1 hypothetical protein Enr10x_39160 [Gimesia panareensis]QDU51427.1 hypothetical protein Pan110_37930 [Gimesia panareensis]
MPPFPQLNYSFCLLFTVTALLTGCGNGDRVTVYPTKGVVLFEGKPMVGGGAISFVPLSALKGKAAGGTIKEDGTFVMSTYEEGDGSIAGEFRVTVHQITMKEPETNPDADGKKEPASTEPTQVVEKSAQIPHIYADPGKSPLTIKIEPDGPNNESLSLELKRM